MEITYALFYYYFWCSLLSGVSSTAERCLSKTGLVRLAGLNSSFIGYAQTCTDGYWTSISYGDDAEWTSKNSVVVCRELGYLDAVRITVDQQSYRSDSLSSPQQYQSVECTGLEEHMADCIWSVKGASSDLKNAFVLCSKAPSNGELSLVGIGGEDNIGFVEIYSETSGWSPVCANEWDDLDAQVACRQLGLHGGLSTHYRSNKDPQTNSKHCSRFLCSGSETRLEDCQYSSAEVVDGEYGALVCSTEAKDDSTLKMNVSILVIMIFTSLLLIAILLLVLRCIVRNFKKKSLPSNRNQISGRTDRSHRTEISRIQLDQDMPYYTSVATVAPPSYRDTLLADQSNPIPTETAVRQHGYIVCDNGDQDSVSLNSSDSFQLINDRLASNNSPNS